MPVATKPEERSTFAKTGITEDPGRERSIWLPEGTWQRIADKAYGFYEQRGRREGYALQDWLDAEYLVMKELYETH